VSVRGGMSDRSVTAVLVALLLALTGCTQGVAGDAGDAGDAGAAGAASPVTTTPDGGVLDAAPSTVGSTIPSTSTSSVASTTSSPAPTTSSTRPPTIADEFAAALAPAAPTVLGAPIPDAARDSVARLWLLLGRPPTATELQTAVTATVRDGVPLDALATLLLHSPERAVGSPDAPPEQFVAGLYEEMLGRRARPGEVDAWVHGLGHGMSVGDVAVGFAESPEAVQRTGTVAHESLPAVSVPGVARSVSDSVLRLYLGLLRRLPTTDELARDLDRYRHGAALSAIADDLVQSDEYHDRRPDGDAAAVLAGLLEDVLGSRPSQAVVSGWAEQLDSGSSPGAVAAAFMESAAVVAHTGTTPPVPPDVDPALPPPVAITPGTDFFAVGDSVMLGASSALTRQFPGIAIDAKVGRQFSEGVDIVRALAAQGTIPGTVIVHLGTNGTVSAAKCDEMMSLLAGKRVVMVNIHVPRPWEGPNNEVLTACAARYAATIVDWHTNATGLAHDGYHLGGSGPEAYATLIAAALAIPPG
jgi:uncharacterized protein DUF4214